MKIEERVSLRRFGGVDQSSPENRSFSVLLGPYDTLRPVIVDSTSAKHL
jgi:hypothetical protein